MITLTLKEPTAVPLEAECLSPDVLAPLKHAEVSALPVFLGKRQRRIDDYFEVAGNGSDDIEVRGDATKVKWIGRGMTRGRIRVVGNAGMHLGAYMTGGSIEVTGNASDWVGRGDVGRIDPHSRQRRWATRIGIPRQSVRHERRDDPRRRLGRH